MRGKKYLAVLVGLVLLGTPTKAQDDVKIGKQNIKLTSNLMTPEALWAMGRIGACEASADGKQIVYQVGYYSVKANKSQQKIAIVNADGTGNTTLTIGTKSETDPTWLNGKIAFLTGGQNAEFLPELVKLEKDERFFDVKIEIFAYDSDEDFDEFKSSLNGDDRKPIYEIKTNKLN